MSAQTKRGGGVDVPAGRKAALGGDAGDDGAHAVEAALHALRDDGGHSRVLVAGPFGHAVERVGLRLERRAGLDERVQCFLAGARVPYRVEQGAEVGLLPTQVTTSVSSCALDAK